jgi:UDPglucose--hexose-1-phosphate uridylyltransferase
MFKAARDYKESTGRVLFDDVIAREIRDDERVIARNAHWIAFVPYAARYPFEIHVAPLQPVADLASLSSEQSDAFPEIALEVMKRLDGVFGIEMAYIAACIKHQFELVAIFCVYIGKLPACVALQEN